tara:strand:+ start:61 stop:1128 length:1068 start_codon:yes stop_codon:yes gene_type:complete
MSLQIDLAHPDLGYFDEGLNLTEGLTYQNCLKPIGAATYLPPVGFRSKVFLEMENEKIWTRDWVAVGIKQQFNSVGDMVPFTVGFHGVHIQQTDLGKFEARLNRHQHGGCRFVPEQCRTGKQTKCTIASCNYTRDSKVMRAREDGENSDEMYKFAGINPAKLHKINFINLGSVFLINVDPGAKLEEPIESGLNIENISIISQELRADIEETWFDYTCNWKLFGEQFFNYGHWDNQPSWLFPNLLCAQLKGNPVLVILQATGMDKTLARCYSNSELLNEISVHDVLKEIGFKAEESHKKFASWGTSSSPDTSVEILPLVENPDFLEFQNYLIANIKKEYTYAWNSPVMDGRMLQRR